MYVLYFVLSDHLAKQKPEPPVKKQGFKGLSVCPNKSNVYHECNLWCETHWKGVTTPDPVYQRKIHKLLAKYPLPMNWADIYDKGCGRYYFWNMENDLVSWLPPKHPKSIKCQSAAKLRENRLKMKEREERFEKEKESTRHKERDKDRDREKDRERERDKDSDDESSFRSKYVTEKRDRERDKDRERDERRYRRDDKYRGGRKRKDEIDPMDPAAYSDIPQGTWSDGLETGKAKAADSTASGAIYQQRPYPAPGEVLAANKEKVKK
nr:unnamed protein product [Callosobruchus chinensis]